MKIFGTSSYIIVESQQRTVKIQGEMVVNGFVAYEDTIKHWEAPYDDIEIDEATKAKIISEVINETKNSNFVIQFEKPFFSMK